ncbi:MAG TPA: 3-keto-5-aminohexanoate cleavage protein [Acidimicrobiales bacterium]|nr:3-keto-5-aminohexanoate cleavage protein [Acidimicrobiales bacterium]
MRADAVIVEAAINEGAMRDAHPGVPYSATECANAGLRCHAAGATIVHWHARDARTGAMRAGDTETYAAAFAPMRAANVLAYPTYPSDPVDDAHQRLAHCFALAREHGLEMGPLDLGTVPLVNWMHGELHGRGTLANPYAFLVEAAATYRALGVAMNLSSFDLGSTRLAVRMARAGVLPQPLLLKIYLSSTWLIGPEPTELGLDMHLDQLPDDVDVEWILVPFRLEDGVLYERLVRHALERGGGVRVGLGDNAELFPGRSNESLVEEVTEWAASPGRPIASADELRTRLGLRAR